MQQTRTILTVDDDPDVLEAVEEFLNGHEYHVVTAQRWTEAIAQLAEASPDAVLLDLHMPTVRGEALLEFIRENYAQLPVVIISAGATPAEMARLGELGANGFIRKPFDTEDLIVILEQVLLDLAISNPASSSPSPNLDAPILPQVEVEVEVEDDELEDDEREDDEREDDAPQIKTSQPERSQLPPGISPGSGIQNLTSMQPQQQQQEVRRRRKKKRTSGRKITRLKKIRNYAAILLLFVGLGYVIYLSQKGFDTNFIGGITFGEQKIAE